MLYILWTCAVVYRAVVTLNVKRLVPFVCIILLYRPCPPPPTLVDQQG